MAPTAAQRAVKKNVAARDLVVARISEVLNSAKLAEGDRSKLDEFVARYDTLDALYNEFRDCHLEILLNDAEEQNAEHETVRKSVDDMFYSIKATHRRIGLVNDTRSSTPSNNGSSVNVKLPKLSIPIFDGTKLNEWPTFIGLFDSVIHNNDSLSPIQKFQYLVTSLAKEPLNVVKAVNITDKNYDIAYKALVARYQNKRLLASHYWNTLHNYPPLSSEHSKALRHLSDTFAENLAALEGLEFPVDSWDFPLFNIFMSKLDAHTKKQFELVHGKEEIPSFEVLKTFVSQRARALETLHNCDSSNSLKDLKSIKPKLPHRPASFVANVSSSDQRSKCIICQASHSMYKCPQFEGKSPQEKFQIAKDKHLCLNCLRPKHSAVQCPSSSSCRTCGHRHHTLLHFRSQIDKSASPVAQSPDSSVQSSSTVAPVVPSTEPTVLTNTVCSSSTILLSTAVVESRDRWGNYQPIRILLDSGSQANFITHKCVQRLGLKVSSCKIPIQGLTSLTSAVSQGVTTAILRPQGQLGPEISAQVMILPNICNPIPATPIPVETWSHIRNIKLADSQFNSPAHIDVLLGAEFFPHILLSGKISEDFDKAVALNTIFGWVLTGRVNVPQSSVTSLHVSLDPSVDQLLQKFWEVEQVPSQQVSVPQDDPAEKIFRKKHYRDSSGRFVVPLLLNAENPTFVDSYAIARRRLHSLEHRFAQNSSLYDSYSSFMKDYLASNHMEPLNLSSSEIDSSDGYYLPHHAVFKIEQHSSKIRVVFDASCKDAEGHSLNDMVLIGPKLQNDITSILLRFRSYLAVFTADIKQMYRQILVRPEERKYQRILWRWSTSEPIQVYQLSTVTYGVSSSPFLAVRTLLQLAEVEKSNFPRASQTIASDIYIDDLVTGCQSLSEAKLLRDQIITIMSRAQLELRKWSSNCPALLDDIPIEHRQTKSLSFENGPEASIKILGLQWNPITDTFSYEVNPCDKPCTKRNILSEVARIYDPLGFLAPLTLKAKHLIQHLWTLGFDWDDVPNSEVLLVWNRFKSELSHLSDLRISRCIVSDNLVSCELHSFCDASSIGYSAVIYFRTVGNDGNVNVHLVCAKSKVAPVKTLSIPRLELCGAVLLANLVDFVVKTFGQTLKFDSIFAWSDSLVALAWIRSSPHRWKPFVAHRVASIQEKLPPSCWHHIGSSDNPADCASRGLCPVELLTHPLWWTSPPWLRQDRDSWPAESPHSFVDSSHISLVSEEGRHIALTLTLPDDSLANLIHRFSSLGKIQRILAYCQRFIHNIRNPMSKLIGPLTLSELQRSLYLLVKAVQCSTFAEDIKRLELSSPCAKPLRKLNPFLDPRGILRVGGRIRHSNLDFESKHPALLPRSHRLTQLIIEDAHRKYLHPGLDTLHYLLRQEFWILSPRRAIRSVLSNCYRCFRLNPRSSTPIMGDLPQFRISQLKPFSHVGLDYAGPFLITMGKYRGAKTSKAYLALFVCMATKALHLELVSDLTAEACLAALRRLIARRGRCSHLYSDCGTNFIGANKSLTALFEQSSSSEHIVWSFNPPAAPNFGGLWEAGVKSVKTHLSRVIGEQILTYEELQTVFVQIEALLNSRPLSELSSDPNDLLPLTPGHFLTMESLSVIPDPDTSHLKINRLSRWQLLQRLHGHFWKRWHMEYLHTLQQRHKWNQPSLILSPGTLVVIKENTTPPMKWRFGRVVELIAGRDGVHRVAIVHTSHGTVKRPVSKLCPLPKQ